VKNRFITLAISICFLFLTVSCHYSSKSLIKDLNNMLKLDEINESELKHISPDGKLIALIDQNDQIIIRSLLTHELVASSHLDLEQDQYLNSIEWSPDSSMILVDSGVTWGPCNFDRVIIFKYSRNQELSGKTFRMQDSGCPHSSWSPDSKRIVLSQNKKMFVINSDAELLYEIKNIPEIRRWVLWTENGIFAGFTNNKGLGSSIYFLGDGNSNDPELLLISDEEFMWFASDSVEKNMALFVTVNDKNSITFSVLDLSTNQSIKEITMNDAIESETKYREIYAMSLTPRYRDKDYSNDEWYLFNWKELDFKSCGPANFELIRYNQNFESFLVINGMEDYLEPFIVDFVKCQP
jgi:WD40 repeat protein